MGIVLLIGLTVAVLGGMYWAISSAWDAFSVLDKTVAISIVTASATVIGSTLAVVIGRYLERAKESDALHRDKKIAMYDEFLIQLFKLFANEKSESHEPTDEHDMVQFLRESQRKFLLWSGPGVIRQYSQWQKNLAAGHQNASTVFQMEAFFLAIRKDLGHSNRGIQKGDMIRFVLRHTDLFLEAAKNNPDITLAQLAELERELGLSQQTENN